MPCTIENTVYLFEELDETARSCAVEIIRGKLTGDWWEQSDVDDLSSIMVFAFAFELRSPGWNIYGELDFPGIDGVKMAEWDLGRGQSISFKGELTRENAPALPWVDEIDSVLLGGSRWGCPDSRIYVRREHETDPGSGAVEAIKDVVEAALCAALKAGRAELDFRQSEQFARDWIAANGPMFTRDGDLYR